MCRVFTGPLRKARARLSAVDLNQRSIEHGFMAPAGVMLPRGCCYFRTMGWKPAFSRSALALPSIEASANGPTITRRRAGVGPAARSAGNPFWRKVSATTSACGCPTAATCRYIRPGPGVTEVTADPPDGLPAGACGIAGGTRAGDDLAGGVAGWRLGSVFSGGETALVSLGAGSLCSCAGEFAGGACGMAGPEASGRWLFAAVDVAEAVEGPGPELRTTT